ncbi:hypothetical protein PC129_g8107 [Phytophthora cactorum]|uniref:Uncharacterized protein n=2 Tax=Phytophthora cactorum TaxID=29920 RepID=A0A329T6H1_9STRA|nr:hypothetical protein GQ600_5301 [Phytophthora cactorum]KAG2778726.1 hypothetical protein Pcac1_g10957 [Phytophthora cactorum]KAG2847827.1 hypothetical protein PC111_g656 [Phytophthora cactorum]KAG2849755.1 hypothetical protein PC112_g3 [Phytophthora cactorum]KAG2869231.1 hypothetical protein PC113_g255 [Phytophthora cactorum]
MLAYARSRSHSKVAMPTPRKPLRPYSPPNSPLDVVISIDNEDEQAQNDGIDFTRVHAELERLLEDSLQESDDDQVQEIDEAQDCNTSKVYQANTTIDVYSTDRLSRSL